MKKIKKYAQIYFTSSLMAMILFVLFSSLCYSGTLVDYENGSLFSTSGGAFRYYSEGDSVLTLDQDQGMAGSNQSMKVNTIRDNFHIWWIQNPNARYLIPEASGCDRMSFYLKIPSNYPLHPGDYNFHIGTYTRDPEIPSNIQGQHYYHYLNIQGSDYLTKIVLNQHPQHRTGSKDTVEDNPEAWNYYDGFTRFYLELVPLGDCPISLPFISHVDEVSFYNVSEPENDETINSISCTYLGDGNFQIGWHGSSQYSSGNCDSHDFEVRYSTSPITNANYSSATIVPGSPFSQRPGTYNFWKADFAINVQDNTRYYFAIKDLDSNIPYVSKIDYPVSGESRGDVEPPDDVANFTATPGVNQISLDWTNPADNDFAGVMIRYSTDGTYPSTITDGTEVPNGNDGRIPGAPGTSGSYLHTGLEDGTIYYYSAFSYDNSGNYSNTAHTFATPQAGGNHVPVISDFIATPSTVTSGDPVTFDVEATDEDGDELTYIIDFGDGTSNGSGNQVVHTYASAKTYTAQATVNDGQEGGSVTQSVEVVVNQQNSGEHFYGYYELEDGTINSPFLIGADENASSGQYVYVREGTNPSYNPQANVTLDVSIPYESDYYIWVKMYGPSSANDAFYVGLDGTFDRVYPSDAGEYQWVKVETVHGTGNYTFHLNVGTHTINVGYGEPLARADQIFITSDSAFVPSQDSTPPPVNVSPTINSFTSTPSSLNNPGETTTFNVSATDPDGDSLTYTIDFGDGTANGSGSQVVHTYETEGTYTATVTVDDGHGNTVGESLQITVNDVPPAKPTGVTAN